MSLILRFKQFLTNLRHAPARIAQLQASLSAMDARINELNVKLDAEKAARVAALEKLQRRMDVQTVVAALGVVGTRFVEISDDAPQSAGSWTELGSGITAENVNHLLEGAHVPSEIGGLIVDLRGNDYWIWRALRVTKPAVVACRFNQTFGEVEEVTTPYTPDFHPLFTETSEAYWGSSVAALCTLAERKGYVFSGIDSSHSLAYFVERGLAERHGGAVAEGTLRLGKQDVTAIGELPLFDLATNEMVRIKDLRMEPVVQAEQSLTKVSDILKQSLQGYADVAKALGQLNALASTQTDSEQPKKA